MPSILSELPSQALSRLDNETVTAKKHMLWVTNASLFWDNRAIFLRVGATVFVLSLIIAFLLPKEYESSARIMPPEQGGNSTAMLAALFGKGTSASLSGLAGSLIGAKNNSALFVSLLHSGTVSGHIINKFDLRHVYKKRYQD